MQFARGMLMGAADIVPGVSGGTVALMLGIYRRLVAIISDGSRALGHLVRGNVSGFTQGLRALDWSFLVPLLAGIGATIVVLASVIEHLLETQPVRMAALFFGLVAGSAVVAARLMPGWTPRRAAVTVTVAVAAFFVLGLRSGPIADPPLMLFFAVGAVAICAMILPGVSGSFLLLMLGMYDNVLGAVSDRQLVTLAVFAVGCVAGLAVFSRVLHWGLVHHEGPLLAILIGLLMGSLRVLWPWPGGTETTELTMPSGDVGIPVLIAVGAAGVVVGLTVLAEKLRGRSDTDLAADLRQL